MAKIKLHNPELAQNSKFSNLVIESLNTDPTISGTVNVGRIWFNSTDKTFKASFLNEAGDDLTVKTIGDSDALTDIENNLAQEVTDRTVADAQLTTDLNSEVSRATAAESGLGIRIDNVNTAAGISGDSYSATDNNYIGEATSLVDADNKLDAALKDEETARIAEDAALDGRVTTVENQVNGKIGDLTTLTTDEKGTIVGSINEVDANTDAVDARLTVVEGQVNGKIGDLTTLTTDEKGTVVGALNEVNANADAAQAELDVTQTGAGLNNDGTYTANGVANYIHGAISLKTADDVLDAALKSEETARIAADAGLTTDISNLTTDVATNYLNKTTTGAQTVAGAVDFGGTVDVTGALTADSNLSVGGNATVSGTADIGSDLTVAGYATLSYDLSVYGNSTLDRAAVTNNLDVGGNTATTGDTTTGGNLTVAGTSGLNGATTVGTDAVAADLTVKGNETVTGNAIVNGTGTFGGDVTIAGNLNVAGGSTIVESEILKIADHIITLNNGIGNIAPTENAGLEVDRGTEGVTKIVNWNETLDQVEVQEAGELRKVATVNHVAKEVATINNATADLQTELDATQTGAGLGTDGAYTADGSTNYISTATSLKNANKKLDTALKAEETARIAEDTALDGRVNTLETQVNGKIGDLTTLTTDEKGTIVGSINEVDANTDAVDARLTVVEGQVNGKIGDLTTLATDDKSTVVAAINELHTDTTNLTADVDTNYLNKTTTTAQTVVATTTFKGDLKVESGTGAPVLYTEHEDGDFCLHTTGELSADVNLHSNGGLTVDGTAKIGGLVVDGTAEVTGDTALKGNLTVGAEQGTQLALNGYNHEVLITGATGGFSVEGDTSITGGSSLSVDGDLTVGGTINQVGELSELSTTKKSSVVDAINELEQQDTAQNSRIDNVNTAAGITGDTYSANGLANYIGEATSLVDADNKLDTQAKQNADDIVSVDARLTDVEGQVNGNIGDLTTLTTDEKGTVVGSINEVDANIDAEVARATAAEAALTSNLNTEISDRTTADNVLGARIDAVNTAAGISGDTYAANGSANFIGEATSLVDADNKLDTALKTYQDDVVSTDTGKGTNLVGFEGYTEADTNIISPTIEINAGSVKSAIDDIASSVNARINEIENRYVKGEVSAADKSDTYTIAHNLDSVFVDVAVQVYDEDETVWRFDLVVTEVIDTNTVKISLASGTAAQIRYVIQGY